MVVVVVVVVVGAGTGEKAWVGHAGWGSSMGSEVRGIQITKELRHHVRTSSLPCEYWEPRKILP